MDNLWKGRLVKSLDQMAKNFNDSIHFDYIMFEEDINGSIAHANMLGEVGIIAKKESDEIIRELEKIKQDIKNNNLQIDFDAEDIHTFIEAELTSRIGDIGKKLHTARSRNDQSAVTTKLFLRKKINEIKHGIKCLVGTVVEIAENNIDTIMPGLTHLQLAQPTTLAHHFLAYNAMFMRDYARFDDCLKRLNTSPLGAGALAGTTFPINQEMTSEALGFTNPCFNSLDAISSRDHIIELASACSILMMHFSRLCEDLIIWNNQLFDFVVFDDAHSTGSSMMPQKKNPDLAELIRGKSGRCYGNLMSLLTMMKGLALSYNKDMQEDKQPIFDSVDTVLQSLDILTEMLSKITFNKQTMLMACEKGFINATDCADYLVGKGVPFRDAYKITGELINFCINENKTLQEVKIEDYKSFSQYFEKDIYDAIDLIKCVARRIKGGGPAPESLKNQIDVSKNFLNNL
ncbi:MAG: argininosuccinate lyase [Defluviitaleaceae bacterium]|nr:argininosuccinate lyase [Defluviitaleaceae bacterium]